VEVDPCLVTWTEMAQLVVSVAVLVLVVYLISVLNVLRARLRRE
jgi:hypothetical protein